MSTLTYFAALAMASTSFGAVTFLDQSRTISVGGQTIQQIMSGTTALGPYADTVTNGFGAPAGGIATQVSLIDPAIVSCRSTLTAIDGLSGYVGYAESRLLTTFRVDQPIPWSIFGSFMAGGIRGTDRLSLVVALTRLDASSTVIFRFERSGRMISSVSNINAGTLGPAEGVLIPDRYRFEVTAITQSRELGLGGYIDSEAEVQLLVPAPNSAGAVTVLGLLANRRRRVVTKPERHRALGRAGCPFSGGSLRKNLAVAY